MSVKLYAFCCGYLTLPRSFLLAKAEGMITVPVPSYLIEHSKGRVLFDTGLHMNTLDQPENHVGQVIAKYHQFHFEKTQTVSAHLRDMQVAPEKIDFVINSHLHFDHCGGNSQLPNAGILIQRREVEHARVVDSSRGYVAEDWDTGQELRLVDGEFDLFGDGSVVCIPTYGHTPGHQSLRIQTERGGEYILCGDACYLQESLEKLTLPGIIANKEAALAVFKRFREMQARGFTIMFGHDPEFWNSVPQAPARLG
ncbi:MAG: N-acyl homoserine lactonase family protein [Gammaproteobacteria bacterium]|nr:N-acyl homoserine lactonase family protein [Gammaproteobacteria bacterium]